MSEQRIQRKAVGRKAPFVVDRPDLQPDQVKLLIDIIRTALEQPEQRTDWRQYRHSQQALRAIRAYTRVKHPSRRHTELLRRLQSLAERVRPLGETAGMENLSDRIDRLYDELAEISSQRKSNSDDASLVHRFETAMSELRRLQELEAAEIKENVSVMRVYDPAEGQRVRDRSKELLREYANFAIANSASK